MSGKDGIEFYRTQFQVKFCFRDAKDFTGLMHCQARDITKLPFHFNALLTVKNLTKLTAKKRNISYSITSYKAMIHNAYLLERFICVSKTRPNKRLKERIVKDFLNSQ